MQVRRYQALVDALADDIRSGRRPPGTRLPTHRALAAEHGVAVVTATRVYAELAAMRLVSGEPGRGTFVRDQTLPEGEGVDQHSVAADAVDLSFNRPAVDGQDELLRRALRDLAGAGDLDALLHYQPHRGRPRDRAAIAHHLRDRGLRVGPERVLVVSGAQHGLAVTMMALLRPGDVVAVDALTYPGFIVLAASLGLDLAAVPVTPSEPDLDAFEQLCKQRPVRAVYAMPTLHNPLGWVLDLAARERLIAIARRHGVLVVEDASYAYLAADPPPPLAALAPERTVYVSGLSKSVATGLRVGFVVAPEAHLSALERLVRATTWNTPALTTAIATRWLEDGTVELLEEQKRRDAAARQRLARDALDGLQVIAHPASYYLWLPLPNPARAERIAAALATERISVTTAGPFTTTPHPTQALRLALGSVPLHELEHALHQVRRAVDDDTGR